MHIAVVGHRRQDLQLQIADVWRVLRMISDKYNIATIYKFNSRGARLFYSDIFTMIYDNDNDSIFYAIDEMNTGRRQATQLNLNNNEMNTEIGSNRASDIELLHVWLEQ